MSDRSQHGQINGGQYESLRLQLAQAMERADRFALIAGLALHKLGGSMITSRVDNEALAGCRIETSAAENGVLVQLVRPDRPVAAAH